MAEPAFASDKPDRPNASPIALVTGGSTGLGLAVADQLEAAGWTTVITRHQRHVDRHHQVAMDVTDPGVVAAAADEIRTRWGAPTAIVCCAGVGGAWLATRTTPERFHAMVEANLQAAFNVAHEFMGDMLRARAGRLIFVSSSSVIAGTGGMSAYVAAKSGLEGLCRVIATEGQGRNVTACVVRPGLLENALDFMPQRMIDQWLARTPQGRLGTFAEVARVVEWAVDPTNRTMSGLVVEVDGGFGAAVSLGAGNR